MLYTPATWWDSDATVISYPVGVRERAHFDATVSGTRLKWKGKDTPILPYLVPGWRGKREIWKRMHNCFYHYSR